LHTSGREEGLALLRGIKQEGGGGVREAEFKLRRCTVKKECLQIVCQSEKDCRREKGRNFKEEGKRHGLLSNSGVLKEEASSVRGGLTSKE